MKRKMGFYTVVLSDNKQLPIIPEENDLSKTAEFQEVLFKNKQMKR